MFTSLLGKPQGLWLLGLLLLWAALLFGGFIFGKVDAQQTRRMPTWTRIGSSLVLVVAAWSWYWFTRGSVANAVALLIAVGMTLGALGDVFMAKLLPVSKYLLWGMGAFGLGHVAYISAFWRLGNMRRLNAAGPRWGSLAVWLLIGLVGWYIAVYRGQKPTVLHWAALPYALLLAGAAGLASGLAVQAPAFVPLALGSALFLLSDLIRAAPLFRGAHFYLFHDVVWLTYGPAQALIVYAISAGY